MSDSYSPDRGQIRSAMRNRYYTPGVPSRRSYTPMAGGMRGLGSICDDTGAMVAMGIIGAATNVIGGAIGAAGAGSGGKGGDAGLTAAGTATSGAGRALTESWAAACLSAGRGAATGTTPTESPADVYARANAEFTAREAAARSEELELQNAQARTTNRNLMIGVGVLGALTIGGIVLTVARR